MMLVPSELLLPNRSGLPDEIAYLRAKYPVLDWPEHPNFGDVSAFWLHVHDSLRQQGGHLKQLTYAFREGQVGAADFQRLFAPQLRRFLHHLEGHHQVEDHAYFPRFRALDRRMIVGFDLLENDHTIIDEKLRASAASAQKLVAVLSQVGDALRYAADTYADDSDQLLDWLLRHLSDEEDLVIPAMLEHSERHFAM
jgi:hypothetical protein